MTNSKIISSPGVKKTFPISWTNRSEKSQCIISEVKSQWLVFPPPDLSAGGKVVKICTYWRQTINSNVTKMIYVMTCNKNIRGKMMQGQPTFQIITPKWVYSRAKIKLHNLNQIASTICYLNAFLITCIPFQGIFYQSFFSFQYTYCSSLIYYTISY